MKISVIASLAVAICITSVVHGKTTRNPASDSTIVCGEIFLSSGRGDHDIVLFSKVDNVGYIVTRDYQEILSERYKSGAGVCIKGSVANTTTSVLNDVAIDQDNSRPNFPRRRSVESEITTNNRDSRGYIPMNSFRNIEVIDAWADPD